MATKPRVLQPGFKTPRSIVRAGLLTLPIVVWSFLMFGNPNAHSDRQSHIAGAMTAVFMIAMFFMMMRTGTTFRWRRWFFVSVGVLFPIGFIHNVIAARGTMGIPIEEMIAGRTPFCFMPIPLLILPASVYPDAGLPRIDFAKWRHVRRGNGCNGRHLAGHHARDRQRLVQLRVLLWRN